MAILKRIILSVLIIFNFTIAEGQIILIRHANKDTAYIREYYRKHLVLRAYESTKFNNFKFIDGPDKLVYKPNDHNIFGLGFNYRFISLDAGIFIPSTGKNTGIYGRTKEIDVQPHLYVHRFIVDLYAQFYHGYYLSNTGATQNNFPDDIEKRPDITTRNISLAVQYVFNDKRFSYNAPFYQNERQKKSAGSFLLGGGIYHTDITGDSALSPVDINYANFFNNYHFKATHNTGIGVNGGYAYTLVIKKLFFLTEIISGGVGVNSATLTTASNEAIEKTGPEFNLTVQLAAGYNSDKYFAGVTYIRLITEDNSVVSDTWQEVNTGNFRFTVAKRIRLKKALIPKSDLIKIE